MRKILALTTIDNTVALKEALKTIKEEHGHIVEVDKVYFKDYESPDAPLDPLERSIDDSDIILVDIRGDIRVARELPRLLKGKEKTIVVLIGGGRHIFAMTRMGKFRGERLFKPGKEREFDIHAFIRAKRYSALTKKLGRFLPIGSLKDMRNWVLAQEYYSEGDPENLKNLILFLLTTYAGVKGIGKVPPPKERPSYGLYLPSGKFFKDLSSFKKALGFLKDRPTVGVLFYGGMHFQDTVPIVDTLFKTLKDDVNMIPVYSQVEKNIEAINTYLTDIDLLVNLQYFRIHGGPYGGEPEPTYDFLQRTDAPCIIGLRAYETEIDRWKEDDQGIDPLETVLGVILPELDGAIEPIFLAGLESVDDPDLGKVKRVRVLEDRVAKLGRRIRRWLSLRRKASREKRIAVITYDYPPGEENLASAGYLDVFQSMARFLGDMIAKGYCLTMPETSLKEEFLRSGMVNSPNYMEKAGYRFSVERYKEWFKTLPIRVQKEVTDHWGPPPGDIMVKDGDILVPGLLLGNVFLGLQPSRGPAGDPDKAYHDKDLPPHHQYLAYYLYLDRIFKADAIVHFGMHGTLEFTKGKEVGLSGECYPDILIGDLPNIYYYWIGNTSEATIAKRRSYSICISHASPIMRSSGLYEDYVVLEDLLAQHEENGDRRTLDLIEGTAERLHLPSEPRDIRRELYRMKRRLIPYGLHIMDRIPEDDELTDFLLGVLRIQREYPSILRLVAERRGLDWEGIKDTKEGEAVEDEAKKAIAEMLGEKDIGWLPKGYSDYLRRIAEDCRSPSESENLLRAMDGRYVLPARGGDPIRDPEVYPSGRAMYAFDPRLVPTVTAEVRGGKAAESIIASYKEKNGRYPETVGIILWGFETMKTGGDSISTILSLLGIRIKHSKSPWFKELEVIPLEQLGRPRIDVVVNICGIFRDTFRTHIDLLNRAIEMVSMLDEPLEQNMVKRHLSQTDEGLGDLSLARIFGPSPTEYATSMRTLVETSSWEREEDLVRSYDDSMNYAYHRGRVQKSQEAFTNIVRSIDIVTQERDNTEYEVTDLDHYYEFLGGLSRTVQEKRGERAAILVVDSTDEDIVVEDLGITIERATRTRTLNPRWIDGLLEHDFHGTKQIKDRVEHLMAFAATTGKVKNWVFDEVSERLIFDEEMRRRLHENNPYATVKLAEVLLESERRGYWDVDKERLKELRRILIDLEGSVE